jgi:hypothetical protein
VEPDPPEKDTAIVRVKVCNFVSTNCAEPVTGLTASLCDKLDVNCTRPIRSGIRDVGGTFMFEINTGGASGAGFNGFLQIMPPAESCTNEMAFGPTARMFCALAPKCDPNAPGDACKIPTFAPALVFFNPPIMHDVEQPLLVPMVPTGAFPALAQAAGTALDPMTGNLFITALNCDGKPAAGVKLTMDEELAGKVTPLYLVEGVISNRASETDASGTAGFMGVPPGFAEISAFTAGANPVHVGRIGVQTAPSMITYSAVVPPP